MKVKDEPHTLMALVKGSKPEPPVSNEEFLLSLVQYGLWFRCLAAWDHVLSAKQGSDISCMSSAIALRAQVAAQYEDLDTLMVALAAWTLNRQQHVADLVSRVQLVTDSKKDRVDDKHRFTHKLRSLGERHTRIDRLSLVGYLGTLTKNEVLSILGVPWQDRFPRSFTGTRGDLFRDVPGLLEDSLKKRAKSPLGLQQQAYNKIKHGPQLCVQCPHERSELRGHTREQLLSLSRGLRVRILFDGARTQDSKQEFGIAPFLSHSPRDLERYFFSQMVWWQSLMSLIIEVLLGYVLKVRPVPRPCDEAYVLMEKSLRFSTLTKSYSM